jgi:hypothetical protein
VDVVLLADQVLLQGHALRNDVALKSFMAASNLFLNLLVVLFTLNLGLNEVASSSYSVHKVCLE